tara:strand:- start:285 stop:851 length:567 start_codon:yes stop_codon:yes gene_type:complete
MESKATNILNDIMQKLSAISEPETKKVENIEVAAEEVTESPEVEEVALSEDSVEEVATEEVETAPEAESTEEVELAEESEKETTEEELEEDSEEVELMEGYVKEEDFNSKIAELEDMIKSIKEDMMVEYEKVESEKAELSAQVEKLSAEPAAEPIAHAPSQKTEQKEVIKFGQNRPANTLDRVFSKLK